RRLRNPRPPPDLMPPCRRRTLAAGADTKVMRTIVLIVGVLGILLGGLWLLQGLGVVHLRPILCFAACEAVQEPSAIWAVVGLVVLLAGAAAAGWALRRRAGENRHSV